MFHYKEDFIMGKINKILVPVDGSDNACKAVDRAIDMAEKAKASLEFVYVASHINEHIPSEIVFDRIWENCRRALQLQNTWKQVPVRKPLSEWRRKPIPI